MEFQTALYAQPWTPQDPLHRYTDEERSLLTSMCHFFSSMNCSSEKFIEECKNDAPNSAARRIVEGIVESPSVEGCQLLLCDPPYNERRERDAVDSEYDLLSEADMKVVVALAQMLLASMLLTKGS